MQTNNISAFIETQPDGREFVYMLSLDVEKFRVGPRYGTEAVDVEAVLVVPYILANKERFVQC